VLLKGATVATLDPPLVEAADLRVDGERIVERARSLAAVPGEEVLDLAGSVVVPGLVNAHTHLYSGLARGMPAPRVPPRNFVEILERVWWRLDRALDVESVYLSGLAGAIEAALSGTTLLIDHHSSPSFIRGSLSALRRALEEVGLRSALCYEVTDRNGTEGRDLGLEENEAFHSATSSASPPSSLTRGMIGGHASFTLSPESLDRLRALVERTGGALHVHAAEDKADVLDCRARYGIGLVQRLDAHGLLAARTLLAHCVHLTEAEIAEAYVRGCWVAHNPRSNMNNAVGYAPTASLKRAALGTDGMDGDMLAETRAAYLKMRDAGRDDAFPAALQLLAGGHRLAAALFGLPFGKLDAGAPADLVVLAYDPPTPLHTDNLGGHLLFGVDRSHVSSVMVAGRFVVRDRRVTTVDAAAAFARAREAARELWKRMDRL
jgi:putative selenium metabolism protein SsnA